MSAAGYMREDDGERAKQTVSPATWFEGVRYHVKSSTKPGETYLCELHLYRGNGVCQCPWFVKGLEKWLRRGYDGERALAEGKVKLIYEGQRPDQALMCKHLIDSHWRFERQVMDAIVEKLKNDTPEEPY